MARFTRYLVMALLVVTLHLKWDANTDDGLAGYRLFMRRADNVYTTHTWEGTTTRGTVEISSFGVWNIIVRAFDTSGNESDNSNEVTYEYGRGDVDKDGDVDGDDLAIISIEYGHVSEETDAPF